MIVHYQFDNASMQQGLNELNNSFPVNYYQIDNSFFLFIINLLRKTFTIKYYNPVIQWIRR